MPSLLYWGFFGQAKLAEPIQWGFSFTPWIAAWLFSLAIAAIVLLVLLVMRYDSPSGAFSASNVFGENIEPTTVCQANGCDYVGHVFPEPNFGPGRVDCLCNGEVKTFQLLSAKSRARSRGL